MSHKNVLTTGEVAKICNVAPRTVSKWFDSGQLRGYRIPGSKDRRIPVDQLVRFMRTHGIPLNGLESTGKRVLLLEPDPALAQAIRTVLTEVGAYEVHFTDSAFEAGVAVVQLTPQALVADVTAPDVGAKALARVVRGTTDIQGMKLIATARGLTDAQGQALLQDGFDAYLAKPFDARALIRLIEAPQHVAPPARSA